MVFPDPEWTILNPLFYSKILFKRLKNIDHCALAHAKENSREIHKSKSKRKELAFQFSSDRETIVQLPSHSTESQFYFKMPPVISTPGHESF